MSLSRWTLILSGLIVLTGITGTWYGEPLLGLWRWPAALLVMGLAWERFQLPTVSVQRQLPGKLALGQTSRYTLTINNLSRIPLKLESQADYSDGLLAENRLESWHLPPKKHQDRRFCITPTRLGQADLGKLHIRQLGRFGLCWWTRVITDPNPFAVEPARLASKATLQGLIHNGNHHRRKMSNVGLEFMDLRDYHHGDPFRNMDWKATAKRGKPTIRRFSQEARLDIAVMIDVGRASNLTCGTLDRLHHYANAAAQLAELAGWQHDRIGCLSYAQQTLGKVPMATGHKAINNMRHFLGQLEGVNEAANALNAALECKNLLRQRGLVIFLTELEQPEAANQLLHAGQLLAKQHQVLVATLEDPGIAATLTQTARRWQDPYRHFAARHYQQGRSLTQQHLQRAGIAVTRANAAKLAEEVLLYYQNHRRTIVGGSALPKDFTL